MSKPKPQNFEAALTRVEAINAQLESSNPSLEESIKLYEEGVNLIRHCQKALLEAEQKVTLLSKTDEPT